MQQEANETEENRCTIQNQKGSRHTERESAIWGSHISDFMLYLHPFLSIPAPSLSKRTVSCEGVHKSVLRLICSDETGSMRQEASLNSSCMGDFDLALGETDSRAERGDRNRWYDGSFLSSADSYADRLTGICYRGTQKSFIPTKSKMWCLLSAGVFYPAVSSLPIPFRPKDAMRALKKRLGGNKNYREVMLALTVRGSYFFIVKLALNLIWSVWGKWIWTLDYYWCFSFSEECNLSRSYILSRSFYPIVSLLPATVRSVF